MDPKTVSSLDPKLKEVYDRVMGGTNPSPVAAPQAVAQTTTNQILPNPQAGKTEPVSPQPVAPAPVPLLQKTEIAPTTPLGKPVVDYAAIAAKYATPTPPISSMPSHATQVVTPSTATYGVVNTDQNKEKGTSKAENKKTSGSSTMKLLLLIGLPIFLIIYTVVWIYFFKIDIYSLILTPQ